MKILKIINIERVIFLFFICFCIYHITTLSNKVYILKQESTFLNNQNDKLFHTAQQQLKTIDSLNEILKIPQRKLKTQISNIVESFNKTQQNKVNKDLMLAIIQVESTFNPNAHNKSGASGLCQLMPATYHKFKIVDKGIFDIESNVLAGTNYVHYLLTKHNNNIDKVLTAYLGIYNQKYINRIKSSFF